MPVKINRINNEYIKPHTITHNLTQTHNENTPISDILLYNSLNNNYKFK